MYVVGFHRAPLFWVLARRLMWSLIFDVVVAANGDDDTGGNKCAGGGVHSETPAGALIDLRCVGDDICSLPSLKPLALQNGAVVNILSRFVGNGGYLDLKGWCKENLLCVSTALSPFRDGASGTWKIERIDSLPLPLSNGDEVRLRNMYSGNAGILATSSKDCDGNQRCVHVALTGSQEASHVRWRLWKAFESSGGGIGNRVSPIGADLIRDGDEVYIESVGPNEGSSKRFLDVAGKGCDGNFLCVSMHPSPKRERGSGSWKLNGVFDQPWGICLLGVDAKVSVNVTCSVPGGPSRSVMPYHRRPQLWDTTFTSFVLVREPRMRVSSATKRWLRIFQDLGVWARRAECHASVVVADAGNVDDGWQGMLKESGIDSLPQPPFALHIRPGLQGRRHVEVVGDPSDEAMLRRLDCASTRHTPSSSAQSWSVVRGRWGDYFTVHGGSYADALQRDGSPSLLWGTEPLLPLMPISGDRGLARDPIDGNGDVVDVSGDGKARLFQLPIGIGAVVVDVGASTMSRLASLVASDRSLLLVAVEPDAVSADRLLTQLRCAGIPPRQRWLVRAAIGPGSLGASATFYRAGSPLCSSLLSPNREASGGSFDDLLNSIHARRCSTTVAEDTVPVLSLAELLRRLPVPVQHLKIDAQGADLEVLRSGDSELHRVREVAIEVQDLPRGDWRRLYPDGHTKADATAFLESRGFVLHHCVDNNKALVEEDCIFQRPLIHAYSSD
eukprot:TRINITY_DN42044_c0_g1_i1.p1 TRINITY_DN42044_c0_g1~~TRINITY_DN42044_c0_g1_i1.p1  ORF type:complete len:728 (-),score=84.54 TRINITY_DN42044_c0_g1_i1:38-2221(-)